MESVGRNVRFDDLSSVWRAGALMIYLCVPL